MLGYEQSVDRDQKKLALCNEIVYHSLIRVSCEVIVFSAVQRSWSPNIATQSPLKNLISTKFV